jgi:hypothetical protein
MTSDLDIYRSAKVRIERHGDEAALYATGGADLLLDDGNGVGGRFMAAVEELRSGGRAGGKVK